MRIGPTEWWSVGLILCIALALRMIGLNSGLWYDEVVTLVEYVRLPTYQLVSDYSELNNHILYSLAAQLSIAIAGESAWSLRLPAALFGVASIAAFWLLAIRVVSRTEALLAALLMACSYHHVWYSQNARGYTALLFCTLVATSFFLDGLRDPRLRNWCAYAMCIVVAMYIHLSAVFTFTAHALVYILVLVRPRLRHPTAEFDSSSHGQPFLWQPIVGYLLGGSLTLLLYAALIPQMITSFAKESAVTSVTTVTKTEWNSPIWTIVETARSITDRGLEFTIALPIAGAITAIGLIDLWRRYPSFTLIGILHVPLTMAILYALGFRIWPRYFFVDAGFAILFLIHGIFVTCGFVGCMFRDPQRGNMIGHAAGVFTALVVVTASVSMLPRNYRWPKQDFQGAKSYIESARASNDSVATVGLASLPYQLYYAPHWHAVESERELDELRKNSRKTWLVYSFSKHTKSRYPDVWRTVSSDFELLQEFPGTLGDGAIFVYRSKSG